MAGRPKKEVKKEEKIVRKTERSEEDVKDLLIRLNRVEGQVRGIKNMVERGDYCVDIMVQVSAAMAALNGFNKELLAKHIETCIVKDIQEGNMEKTKELAELIRRTFR